MTLSTAFFGTPGFCQLALDAMIEAGRKPRAVVCQPDRPSGRGRKLAEPPAKEWAQRHSVCVLQPLKCSQPEFLDEIRALEPDLGIVYAYGQLLPAELLSIPRLGFINIHPSLLPRYRGAAPVQWALINGDTRTGVSIVKVTPRLDDGDILLQEALDVDPDETAVELGERLAVLGGQLVVRALDQLESGQASPVPQDEDGVTWARALKKEDGQIEWNRPAADIHNRIRGVQPWPGAFTRLGGKMLKIHRAELCSVRSDESIPGRVVKAEGEDLQVGTADGFLQLREVQLEGKKRMDARTFLLGRPVEAGDALG
jgi:methionyl-tRNA formyltransferase